MRTPYSYLLIFLLLGSGYLNVSAQSNLALHKKVTSSSSADTVAHPNSHLVDGDFSTFALSGSPASPPAAEWFLVDLGQDYFIDSVVIGARPGMDDERRLMLVTYSAAVSSLGNEPVAYVSYAASTSLFNRLIYTDGASVSVSANALGTTPANPNVPGLPGRNLGPAYPASNRLGLHTGLHKARYILLFNLQDTSFNPTELQVFGTTIPAKRTISNGSFEQDLAFSSTTFMQIREGSIPHWSTTEAVGMSDVDPGAPLQGSFIEIWKSGFMSVPAASGAYFAELNAFSNGMLEQEPICVRAGETFHWSFAHRGRNGPDTMNLRIDDIDVATFMDNNAAGGIHSAALLSGGSSSTTLAAAPVALSGGWTQWSGTWTNLSTASRIVTFGYRAVGSSGGSIGGGNFLDSVVLRNLSTFISFNGRTGGASENTATDSLPTLYLNGRLDSALTIQVRITGGTATRGLDYRTVPDTGLITIPLPAANYDGTRKTAISLAPYLQILKDTVFDPDETIELELTNPSSTRLQVADSSTCIAPAFSGSQYIIRDAIPLPAQLLSFSVQPNENCSTEVSWTSGLEHNLVSYQVERQTDGANVFDIAARVWPKGNYSKYSFRETISTAAGTSYRLVMTDAGGHQSYSKTVRLKADCDPPAQIVPVPNPASGQIRLSGIPDGAAVQAEISDALGRRILSTTVTGNSALDISSLAPGIYLLQVQHAAHSSYHKLLVR